MQTKKQLIMILMVIGILTVSPPVMVQGDPIPGQAVMKIIQNGKPEDVLQGSGARLDDSIPGCQTFLIEIDQEDDWNAIVDELEADSQVIFVEPNYSVELPESFQMSISFPDDYAPPLLDGVEPSSFFDQSSIYSIGLDQAQLIATGAGITVAVIDNGVDFSHPFLASRLLPTGYDFMDGDNDPAFEAGEVAGHGTFVSGLVALAAPDCQILPFRAFDGNGSGNTFAIAEAIYSAVDQGVDVINMSFGTIESNRIMVQACNQAILNGVAMVAACGNVGHDLPTYPASLPGVIAVSGIGADDYLAAFSNYGDYIDVCAPGVNLYSALAGDDDWGTWSGTSFAAPLVAAACALVRQISPDYSTFIMQEHIRQTASTNFLWGTLLPPDPSYGYGRIDVFKAADLAGDGFDADFGDLNGNGTVNAGDIVYLVQYVYSGGPPPVGSGNADMNCDGVVDAYDIEYFVNRIYNGGPRCGRCK